MSMINTVINMSNNDLGQREGSTWHTQLVNDFNKYGALPRGTKMKTSYPWCDCYISELFRRCGLSNLVGKEMSCGYHIAIFKELGIWEENDNITPNAGDIILYDWDRKDGWPEHIGLVVKVSGSYIYVNEGNYSNMVKQRKIKIGDSSIRGYAKPKYTGAKPSPEPAPTPTPSPEPEVGKLKVDGVWGMDTTRKAQVVFGTYEDAFVSNQRSAYKGKYIISYTSAAWKFKSYGSSPLIKAIQKKIGSKQDGIMGPNTILMLQKFLNSLGYGLVEDKQLGKATVKAFQKWLNTQ